MRLSGELIPPGDKSISHRAVMLNAIAYGEAKITNFLTSDDCMATIEAFKLLGVKIKQTGNIVKVFGEGFKGLHKPKEKLDCKNSGTTARLLMGVLSGLSFESTLIGDESLSKRPMLRVASPLRTLNANIDLDNDNFLPAKITPSIIKNGNIILDVASAQVKSAVILAALKNEGITTIVEKASTRNHTELLLKSLGADLLVNGNTIHVSGKNTLFSKDVNVPGDISSAAFFIVAALIVPDSEIVVLNCGLNSTRTGILQVLDQINADYRIMNKRVENNEEVGDILIKYTEFLLPFVIEKDLVPLLIDEIPILTLLATQIEGVSYIRDAQELRVKESDRIKATATPLNKLNANVIETTDGMIIYGKTKLLGGIVNTYHDHRISMMLKVASLICSGMTIINGDCDRISFPDFERVLYKLLK